MSKYEDEALEMIKLVAENSHNHAAKSFGGRSVPTKGEILDAKAVETCMLLDKIEKLTETHNDEDSHQQMNMRPPSEPRYNLRKRTHPQLQQHAILFLSKKFEKLTIQEVSDEDLSKPSKESVDPMGITFPPLPFIN